MKIKTSEFKAWLKKQPKGKKFDYLDIEGCAVCQFVRSRFKANGLILAGSIDVDFNGASYDLPKPIRLMGELTMEKIGHKSLITREQILKLLL